LTKDEQSVAEGWLGLGLESAFLCFACAEAVYTAGKKNKQRRSAKSRPFFKDFFCNICSKHVRLRDFLGGISKNNLIRDLRTYEVPLVLNFLQQNISKRTKKGKFFSISFMLFFVWFLSHLC